MAILTPPPPAVNVTTHTVSSVTNLHRLKHVTIEISSKQPHEFEITASLMGVKMSEKIVFQDLLQAQYENIVKMKMFDDLVTVNVNLLIFLINKKFYNK